MQGATRGPVTAVAGIEGHLIVAIGSKLMVYLWTGEKLEGCAFFDAPMQVVSSPQSELCSCIGCSTSFHFLVCTRMPLPVSVVSDETLAAQIKQASTLTNIHVQAQKCPSCFLGGVHQPS